MKDLIHLFATREEKKAKKPVYNVQSLMRQAGQFEYACYY